MGYLLQLLQQSAAAAPYLVRGVSPHAAPPDLERGVAPLGPPAPAQPPLLGHGVAKMGLINDRNDMDLTEAEGIKKR